MVWLIVWAGLLIVVLYSPIGSPDLYSPTKYYFINQTIPAEKGTILHAPKKNFKSDNNSNDTELPDISQPLGRNYAVGNYPSANNRSQGTFSAVQTQSYQTNSSSGSGNGSIGATSFLSSESSHRSDGTSGVAMTNGMTTLSLSTNLSNNGLTKESVNTYSSGSGGTDPGGDPPGDPIPIGDGWGIFIFMGVLYSIIKVYTKKNSTVLLIVKSQIKKE